jgi:RNA polymerase sigma factor (sigma-70 family)
MIKREQQQSLSDIVEGVKTGEQRSQSILYAYLYEYCYPVVERYLKKSGGEEEDAEDCFQQAVMVLFSAVESGKFTLSNLSFKSHDGQLSSYIMSVCKNLWRKELRWRGRPSVQSESSVEARMIADLPASLVADAYHDLGAECKQLLAFYFKDRMSARVIAGRLKRQTQEVKKQLANCTNRLVKEVGNVLGGGQQDKLMSLLSLGLEDLEERCRNILTAFYFERQNMTEIAEAMGYANAHVVTEQKNRCMKRLNEAIVNRMLNG